MIKRCVWQRRWLCILSILGLVLFVQATRGWAQNTFPAIGNVGIGTATPGAPLHVGVGSLGNQKLLQIGEPGFTGDYGLVLRGNPSDGVFKLHGLNDETETSTPIMSWTRYNGHVGIGTAAPGAPLHVGVDTIGNAKLLQIGEPGFTGNYGLVLRGNPIDGVFKLYGLNAATETSAPIMSWTRYNGRVGIGTASPQAPLHVAGDAQIDGNIAAKYQDVAEWVRTADHASRATVVVIDGAAPNQVVTASQPYDTRVAGVVSERPGVLLGEAGEDKAKVAHSGRVKVKVDARYGAVAIGDLLVTSPTAGHAMRSAPVDLGGMQVHRPGTLLGKALEPFPEGQGEILVLLMLQ